MTETITNDQLKQRVLADAREVFDSEIAALEKMKDYLNGDFFEVFSMVVSCTGKIVYSGMGKSGHIARKIAATMASLGKAAVFMHPAEALHGDLGTLERNDLVILISNSGESEEIIRLLPSIKLIGCQTVGITNNPESTLAKGVNQTIVFPDIEEACQLKLAPTSTTTVTLVLGDALSVSVSKYLQFNQQNFAVYHPAGSLGKKLIYTVKDLMHSDEADARVTSGSTMKDTIIEMSGKALGIVNVVEGTQLMGVFTDGDLRKYLARSLDVYGDRIDDYMTENPVVVKDTDLAVDALTLMNQRGISALPVMRDGVLAGTIRINDITLAGIVG